jgi:hypothetical protein
LNINPDINGNELFDPLIIGSTRISHYLDSLRFAVEMGIPFDKQKLSNYLDDLSKRINFPKQEIKEILKL